MTITKTTEQIEEAITETVKNMCEWYYNEVLRIKDEVKQYAVFMDKTTAIINSMSYQLGYLHIENSFEVIDKMLNIRDKYAENL